MSWAECLGLLMAAWVVGYVAGFKLRMITDALNAS